MKTKRYGNLWKKERLSDFTDAVLAIIMTILVLELEKPSKATIIAGMVVAAIVYPPAIMISVLVTLIVFVMTHQALSL